MRDLPTIGDPTNKVVLAVQRGADEGAVTLAYAHAIQRIGATEPHRLGLGDPGFTRANTAIMERWGPEVRDRLKERAWELVVAREGADGPAYAACMEALTRDIPVRVREGVGRA